MQIILLRHGEPENAFPSLYTAKGFKDWINTYNLAPVSNQSNPSSSVTELAINCNQIICSDLTRSVDSAERLGLRPHLISKEFREMELPYSDSSIGLKLSPTAWLVLFRILWMLGYSKNSESFNDAKVRALVAANTLENMAKEKGKVLFVGHRYLNKYIAKKLTVDGWLSLKKSHSKYWGYSVFEKELH